MTLLHSKTQEGWCYYPGIDSHEHLQRGPDNSTPVEEETLPLL